MVLASEVGVFANSAKSAPAPAPYPAPAQEAVGPVASIRFCGVKVATGPMKFSPVASVMPWRPFIPRSRSA